MKKELKGLEDQILFMLSNAKGNILDDEELINTLAQSKVPAPSHQHDCRPCRGLHEAKVWALSVVPSAILSRPR